MAALRVSTIKRLSTSCSKSHRVFCVFQSSFPCLIPASLCKHDEFIPQVAFKYPIIAISPCSSPSWHFMTNFLGKNLKVWACGVFLAHPSCVQTHVTARRGLVEHRMCASIQVHLQEGVQMFMQKHSFQPSGEQTPSWFYAMRFLHQLAPWWKRAPFGYLFLKCAGNRWSLGKKAPQEKSSPWHGAWPRSCLVWLRSQLEYLK